MAECGGDVKLAAVQPPLFRLLEITRLNEVFHSYPSVEDALKAFPQAPAGTAAPGGRLGFAPSLPVGACLRQSAGTAAGPEALASMADAERAFARAAAARGMRAAFLEFLDDEAIGFHPALGRAKDQWASRPEPAEPARDDARLGSADGRGLSRRPTRMAGGALPARARRRRVEDIYGCYSSIWRRDAQGAVARATSTSACRRRRRVSSRPASRPLPADPAPRSARQHASALLAAGPCPRRLVADRRVRARVRRRRRRACGSTAKDSSRPSGRHASRRPARGPHAGSSRPWTAPSPARAISGSPTGARSGQATRRRTAGYYLRAWRVGPAAPGGSSSTCSRW